MNYRSLYRALGLLCRAACPLLLVAPSLGQTVSVAIQTQPDSPAVTTPFAVSTDVYGNIYATTGTSVVEIPANGGPLITIASGLASARGVAADSLGNVYIALSGSSSITKVSPGGARTTVGSGLGAPFLIALDSSGNLYVPDSRNNRVVKISPGGTQTVLGFTGLNNPHGVAVDSQGNIYVTNFNSASVSKLSADGLTQTTLPFSGLSTPYGIAVDAAFNVFVADATNGRVVELPAGSSTTTVVMTSLGTNACCVATTPHAGELLIANESKLYDLQPGAANFYGTLVGSTSTAAQFTYTVSAGVTLGAPTFLSNNSTTAQFGNGSGTTATTCTTGKAFPAAGTCILNVAFTPKQPGAISGAVVLNDNSGNVLLSTSVTGVGQGPVPAFAPGTQSTFLSGLGNPAGVAVDAAGNLYLADTSAGTVSKVTSAGVSSPLPFSGLTLPSGVAVDGAGNVYVSDSGNNLVYKLSTKNVQTTLPTTGLSAPMGIALDGFGDVLIADSANQRVVRIDPAGVQTTAAFTGLADPSWVAVDPAGNIFVADTGKVIELSSAGVQSTLNTPGLTAPAGLGVLPNGSLYIADSSNGNVYVLPSSGSPFTLAGNLSNLSGLAIASNGSIYISNPGSAQVVLLDRTMDSITFPGTAINTASAPTSVTVQNNGNTALDFSGLSASSGFALVPSGGSSDCSATATVNPGATCTIAVTFNPTTLGNATGSITQTDNALNVAGATQTVQLAGISVQASTTSLAQTTPASGNAVYGQSLTITSTVAPVNGSATPTGKVIFSVDGTAMPAITLSGGQAVYTATGLAAGAHTFTAAYSGDTTYAASNSSSLSITVTPAPLTVTAASPMRAYGVDNGTLTYTITGFVLGDTQSVVSGAPVLATTATSTSKPATYAITISSGTLFASNYTFNLVPGSITVTQAANTITFPAIANVTYGTNPITPSATASSGLPIAYSIVSGPATISGATITVTGTGIVTVAANQAGTADYVAATQVTRSFTVSPALLTVTATALSKEAGQANPPLTYTIIGFVYNDTQSVVTGVPAISTTATISSPVGPPYLITITQGSLTTANYTFNFVDSTLTVTGTQPQTITFNSIPNTVYGAPPILLNATASSGEAVSYTVTGPATLSGSSLTIKGVGTVSVTANQLGDATYAAAAPITRTFTAAPAVLTVAAANASRLINTPNLPFTYAITGFVNNDPQTVVSGTPALTTTATTTSPVGTYPIAITAGSLVATNYTFNLVPGVLTINPDTQTITFAPLPAATYGAAPITLSATASSSLPVSYSVTGPAALSAGVLTITGVGTVSVTASQAGDATNAPATPVTQTFTVAPAVLTVTANNANITFGQPLPSLSATITGFVNGQGMSVVTGLPALTTTAPANPPGGQYPITPAQGTLSAANYTFIFVNGSLTVGPATQTIAFGTLPNVPQTTAPITLTATASSGLPVTYSVTGPGTVAGANVLTITGTGIITVTASQPGNASYAPATPVTQTFTATATTTTSLTLSANTANQSASVTLTAKVTAKITGSPTGSVSFQYGSTVIGTSNLNGGTATLSTTNIPSGTISLTAVYSGNATFSPSTSPASSILVIAPDYNISATNTNLTIAQGTTATTVITITPVGAYQFALKFDCGSLPANLQCSFAPAALNFYGSGTGTPLAQTTTLTFTATSNSSSILPASRDFKGNRSNGTVFYAMLGGLPLCMIGLIRSRRNGIHLYKALRLLLVFTITAMGFAGISGCGSGSTTPTQGTYTIPVTFTDGTLVNHVLTLTVTIQ